MDPNPLETSPATGGGPFSEPASGPQHYDLIGRRTPTQTRRIYRTSLALAIAPRESVLEAKVRELGGASLIAFDPASRPVASTALAEILRLALIGASDPRALPLQRKQLERTYTAAAVSAQQLRIFIGVLRELNPPRRGRGLARHTGGAAMKESRRIAPSARCDSWFAENLSAAALARRQCALFDQALSRGNVR